MPKSWSTRREARAQPFTQYDETGLQALLDSFEARMTKLNDMYLRLMGEHIADIGTLWPSDVHRLQQIRRMNKNLHDIERRIAEVAGQSREEIETLFQRIAQEDARMAGKILGAPDTVNVKDNLPLQRILRAQARETAGRMTNLANSTALSGKYRDAVDVAVNAVQSGVEDYGSAIRRVIREAGQSGLRVRENGTRVVDYESGRSVRIDTAARMSVLDGVRHLNQSIMEEVGRQFGADGVEIDAHMLCAEDHVPYQGGQYSNEEFEQIQDSLQRPFGEWNCRHSWHPIMLGISPRTYTDDELSEMRRYSTEPIEIDGRTKTRYQWSQEMRRVETRIRQVKDTATLARYSGDDVLRRQCQQQIGILNERYKALTQGTGLKPEYQRTYVAGFRDTKTNITANKIRRGKRHLTESTKSTESTESTGQVQSTIQSDNYTSLYRDITNNWYPGAVPGSHEVRDLHELTLNGVTYIVDGKNVVLDYKPQEKAVAEMLARDIGGETYMVPRVNNPQGISTPDILFNGNRYDLKTIHENASENTIYNRIKNGIKQAEGFIVDITKSGLDENTLNRQIEKVFWSKKTQSVNELVIIRDTRIIKVLRRNKQES